MSETSKIFSSARIADLVLRNRIIRAGCFEGMCQNESPSELLLEHHRAVAAGGIGMSTVAYCGVSRDGLAFGHEMWMREEILPMLERIRIQSGLRRLDLRLGQRESLPPFTRTTYFMSVQGSFAQQLRFLKALAASSARFSMK